MKFPARERSDHCARNTGVQQRSGNPRALSLKRSGIRLIENHSVTAAVPVEEHFDKTLFGEQKIILHPQQFFCQGKTMAHLPKRFAQCRKPRNRDDLIRFGINYRLRFIRQFNRQPV